MEKTLSDLCRPETWLGSHGVTGRVRELMETQIWCPILYLHGEDLAKEQWLLPVLLSRRKQPL